MADAWTGLNLDLLPGMAAVWRYQGCDMILLEANRQYRDQFFGDQAAVGMSLLWEQSEMERTRLCGQVGRHVKEREELSFCIRATRGNGQRCRLQVRASFLAEDAGGAVYLGLFTDVTEHMLVQKERDDAYLELVRVQEELGRIYDAYPDGMARVERQADGGMRLLFANRAFYRLIGYEREQFQQELRSAVDGLSAEGGSLFRRAETEHMPFHWGYRKRGGAVEWAGVNLTPVSEGDPEGQWYLTLTDFRSLIALEQERYQDLLDRITEGGVMVRRTDESPAPLYVSENIPKLLGYTMEEFQDQLRAGYWGLLAPEDGARLRKAGAGVPLPAPGYSLEYRVRKKDGSYLWIFDNTKLDTYFDGTPVYFSILSDATRWKETEGRLRVREEEYRLAVAQSGKMVYRFDLATRAADITAEAAELFGLSPTMENVPESVIELGSVEPESVADYRAFYDAMLRGEPSGRAVVRRRVRSGESRWFLGQFTMAYGADGAPCSAVGTFEDISEQLEKDQMLEKMRQERELLRVVAAHSGRTVFKYDVMRHTAYLGEELAARFGVNPVLSGLSKDSLRLDQVARESQAEYLAFFQAIERGEPSGSAVVRRKDAAENYAWYQTDFTLVRSNRGEPAYAVISFEDVSGRYEKELAYRQHEQGFAALPPESYTYYAFNLTRDRCDYERGGLIGHAPDQPGGTVDAMVEWSVEHFVAETWEAEYRKFNNRTRLLQVHAGGKSEVQLELLSRNGEGTRWVLERAQLFEDPYSGDVRGMLSYTDIDREKRNMLSLLQRADHDALTGLLNRAAFTERVDRMRGDGGVHALLLVDLDGFKGVNDAYGHVSGDHLLMELGAALQKQLRANDLLARLGGDEFIICLTKIPDAALASRRAEAMCKAVKYRFGKTGISASIGVAVFPEDGRTFDELYAWADNGLYAAKSKGGDRCVRAESRLVQPPPEPGKPGERPGDSGVFIRAFGHFDVFLNREPISFSSAKAKELLAVLVDRRGGILTSGEAVSLLWEDEPMNQVTLSRYRKVALRLKKTLDEAGLGDLLISRKDGRCVDVTRFTCDYYLFLDGAEEGRGLFQGSYMSNYSWGESTLAALESTLERAP